jgi:hypothetical protein
VPILRGELDGFLRERNQMIEQHKDTITRQSELIARYAAIILFT